MDQPIGERQTIWGWQIALYLFLAGGACGAYVTGVAAEFASRTTAWDPVVKIGVTIGAPLVAFSTIFLVLDLGRPFGFVRAASHPRTSWISRGVFILSAFIIVGLVHLALVWTDAVSEGVLRGIGVAGGTLAVITMVYTGLLLGSARAVPFWSTPALPMLFLVSALSAGMMSVTLILSVYMVVANKVVAVESQLLKADIVLLVIEAFVVFSYLYLVRASLAAKASVDSLLRGDLSLIFWVGFVVLGLLIPLSTELALLDTLEEASQEERMAVALLGLIPGLAGGYILRHLVMSAAIRGPLVVIGRLVPLPGRPRLIP
ncbi:MAG: polysulfide reductase NrfD [Dehalococcoidia bacterium]|jgi:formate-dependent nitrite reductase membrane component NrfD|nr:polysulfide reductase NrfD [Dehalococcoidia bacterium]